MRACASPADPNTACARWSTSSATRARVRSPWRRWPSATGSRPSSSSRSWPPSSTRGIVRTTLGAHGGYAIAADPSTVSLGRVIRLLDGALAPLGCVSLRYYEPCSCVDEATCPLRDVMIDVRDAMLEILDEQTLADLAARPGRASIDPRGRHADALAGPDARRTERQSPGSATDAWRIRSIRRPPSPCGSSRLGWARSTMTVGCSRIWTGRAPANVISTISPRPSPRNGGDRTQVAERVDARACRRLSPCARPVAVAAEDERRAGLGQVAGVDR